MTTKAAKRAELIERVAERLLAVGAAQIPLRDLAAELGTSDRMLLYYFRDKSDLVEASLEVIASRLSGMLDAVVPSVRAQPAELLLTLLALLRSDAFTPAMTVWADIIARGNRGEEPFQRIAGYTVLRWLDWLEHRLDLGSVTERRDAAAAILTIVEGARQLEASAPGSTRQVGATLSRAFGNV
ncbi:TetR family transcriptional regulator [Caulobacter sp. BK020]|uniref:TetR/AcrR family transcriptional regulator n=1 Tax=Caulobacter sp. BK020 TaxID=2512117 RepID=UPI00104AC0A9|nr:TetR family transcriptional regulator [Caulobacter sp. BK020]